MPLQILALGFLGLGILAVTAYAFYRQGRKDERQKNIRLAVQHASLEQQMQETTDRFNQVTVKLARYAGRKLYIRNGKTFQPFPPAESGKEV